MGNASLNNIPLAIETISDGFAKAVSVRHIPFSDKALLRDLGLKERTIRIRCYFWADTYDQHKALLQLLWGQTDFELNHPEYGLLQGKVGQINVRDDDRVDTAEIDLDFMVGVSEMPAAQAVDIGGESEGLYMSGVKEAETEYRDRLVVDSVLPVEIVDLELDPAVPTILAQMPAGFSPDVRAYVKDLDQMLAGFDQTVDGITAPVGSLVKEIDFAAGIPGRVAGTIAATLEKQIVKFASLRSAPTRFIDSLVNDLARFTRADGSGIITGTHAAGDTVPLADNMAAALFASVASLSASAVMGEIYGEDETLRSLRLQMEGVQAFDALGNYHPVDPVDYPMNVREIEATLAAVRGMADTAVAENREVSTVKLLSDKLLEHVVQVKLDREKIINVEVANAIPLHMVCLRYGLPYKAADRIMLINRIRHPNFTQGRIDIYAS